MYIDLSELSDGFSSKFRVISFFLAVNKIRNLKRIIYIYEKKTKDSPYLFTDLCLIKNFKVIKLRKKPKTDIKFNPYNHNIELKKLKRRYFIDHVPFTKFNIIANSSYRKIAPNYKIKKKLKKLNLPNEYIAIHIRSTDRSINLKNFLTKIQFQEMIFEFQIEDMIKKLPDFINQITKIKNVFISSDDKQFKYKFLKKLENKFKVFSLNAHYKTKNFRQTSGEDFLTELLCLSRSKIIISTVGGAVPNSASLISRKKIKIYKWTNKVNLKFFFKIIIVVIFYVKRIKSLIFNKKFILN